MKRKFKKLYLAAMTASLVFALPISVMAEQETMEAESSQEKNVLLQEEQKLYITVGDHFSDAAYDGEVTLAALIDALAKETGWNLNLAGIDEEPELFNVTVRFAQDSFLYEAMPEEQKEEYIVSNKQELIYSVFSSVADTIYYNTNYANICFASPEGERIDLEEEDCTLHLSSSYSWSNSQDYENTQIQLSDDSIGMVRLLEQEYMVTGGIQEIHLLFYRPKLERGTGKIEIYDGEELFFQADVTDEEIVEFSEPEQELLDKYNQETGTLVTVYLDKAMGFGKEYQVNLEQGAFKSGNISSKEVKDIWTISTSAYGIMMMSEEKEDVKVGDTQEFQVTVGNNGTEAKFVPVDPEAVELSKDIFAEDGTLSITFLKEGCSRIYIYFTEPDGGQMILAFEQNVKKED